MKAKNIPQELEETICTLLGIEDTRQLYIVQDTIRKHITELRIGANRDDNNKGYTSVYLSLIHAEKLIQDVLAGIPLKQAKEALQEANNWDKAQLDKAVSISFNGSASYFKSSLLSLASSTIQRLVQKRLVQRRTFTSCTTINQLCARLEFSLQLETTFKKLQSENKVLKEQVSNLQKALNSQVNNKVDMALYLRSKGNTVRSISQTLDISIATVNRYLKQAK